MVSLLSSQARFAWTSACLIGVVALAGCRRNSSSSETEDASQAHAYLLQKDTPPQGRGAGGAGGVAPVLINPISVHSSEGLKKAIERVRVEDYAAAGPLLEQLGDAEKSEPFIVYLRLRVAKELGNCVALLPLAQGLESKLGVLGPAFLRTRAECELAVGPFENAARYFGSSEEPADWLLAALAEEHGERPEPARKLVEKALSKLTKGQGELEFQARLQRARLAEKLKLQALAATDLRWLATRHPTRPETSDADTRLAAVWKYPLTSKERLERVRAFSKAGMVERCAQELKLVDNATINSGERLSLLGFATYASRKDYLKAATLFTDAAKKASREPVQDLFYAARALSRGDQDEHALKKYDQLARTYPKTQWAEHARYQRARLLFILGRFKEARDAYLDYRKRYTKNARHQTEAERELGVIWLILGEGKRAEPVFTKLAAQTKASGMAREARALAMELGGNKPMAAKSYREIISDEPLSFAALLSRLRLRALGEPVPELIAVRAQARPSEFTAVLPEKVRLLLDLGLDRDAERALLAEEAEFGKRYAARKVETLCTAYARFATAERRFQLGTRNSKPGLLERLPSAESGWIFDCAYPRAYADEVKALSTPRVSQNLIFGLIRQESAFRVRARSSAEARGLMQLIEPTAQKVAEELGFQLSPAALDAPHTNLALGTHYLDSLLRQFQGAVPLALAAYNAGPTAVGRWSTAGKGLPLDLFVAMIPYAETRKYVERVMTNWIRYAYLAGDEDVLSKVSLTLPSAITIDTDAY